MPTYEPIDPGVPLNASASDLAAFRWEANGVKADFVLPGNDDHLLRVSFGLPCIVRLLDEMALSTEADDGPSVGLVPEHFAYQLRDAAFERMQSVTWVKSVGPTRHYQFVTGWTCVDVISAAYPLFSIVTRPWNPLINMTSAFRPTISKSCLSPTHPIFAIHMLSITDAGLKPDRLVSGREAARPQPPTNRTFSRGIERVKSCHRFRPS